MRKVITLLSLFIAASAAQAQIGPTAARAISKPMPSKAPGGVQTFNAEAELIVSKKGRVDYVDIISSSGDPSFDKEWKKSLSDWRYVPAIDADGQPVESHSRVTYKNNGLSERPSYADGTTPPVLLDEATRFDRLTCKDFLWEYYIITNAMPRRLALMDPLLKTPMASFVVQAHPEEPQLQRLRERYDDILDDAAKECRDNPEANFWSGVLKPMMQGALTE